MAEVMEITEEALGRWLRRHGNPAAEGERRGRPEVIPSAARERIRRCYVEHYRQWGPQVLRSWCRRADLGHWSAGAIASAIGDLREEKPEPPSPVRYEITASDVMWSEDGTGFGRRGRKKELLVIQDEHARLKLGYRLTPGPADEKAVYEYLSAVFARHGAPLVLKHDGGSIFHGERIGQLLAEHRVIELTGPRRYPQYNGKQERSMRDIKSYERAMRRHGVRGRLTDRLRAAVDDLNEERPRPMLDGRTARETYEEDRRPLPERRLFIRAVEQAEQQLLDAARSRREKTAARRRAVEQVLLRYGLMQEWSDMSHYYRAKRRTK